VIGAGDSGKAIVCTYTNTRKSTTFRLAKAWGANSTQATWRVLGDDRANQQHRCFNQHGQHCNTNGTLVTVYAGRNCDLTCETMSPGTLANYTTTVSCDAGTLTGTNGQSAGNTLAITAAATATSPITCTYTNTPKTATLQLAKAWGANSSASDSASIGATTGGTNNTTLFSTAGGTAANSGAAVAITVGNTITFPAETGTNIGNYNTVLSCLAGGGATANTLSGTNGQVSNTLVIGAGDSGKAIVCTYTNTRKSTTFRLAKAWGANSTAGNIASLAATTGLINNTAVLNSTASTNSNGVAVTVFAGETATLPAETMSPGTLANYTTTVSCDAGTLTGTNGQSAGNTLAITAAATATSPITCTYTNTPKTATLQLAKAWGANSSASDSASIGATTGGTNNTSLFSTAGGTAANSGTAVAITVGNTITFPAETGTNIGNYNTVLSCLADGGATANTLSGTNGQASNTLVIGAGDSGKAIVCTYTNTRKSTTFRLAKAWGANSTAGNIASLAATTGLINNTAVLNSTASTATNGTLVTVFAGETATLPAETMSPGTLANYTTTVSCDAGTLTGTNGQSAGNTLAITAAATATSPITCTYTNTPKTATLQLAKAWGANSSASDSASIGATTGGTNNTTLFSTAGGTAANSGAAVAITVGNTITFPAETGTNIGNYNTVLSCLAGGGATANTLSGTNGQVSNTLVIGAGDSGKAIVCTYTNTRKSTTFRLAKAWGANSTAGNIASLAATTGLINNTAVLNSTASTNSNGVAVTVFAGETATLPAETMSPGTLANYTTTVSCDAGTLTGTNGQSAGNTLAITAAATATSPITCTYTNTPKTATLQLAKAWGANSSASDSASIGATTGGTNNTSLFSTAGGTAANSGTAVAITVGNTITFPAETGTNIGNYNTVLSCLADGGATANTLSGTNGQASNTLVIGAGDSGKAIVCTYTNTRKSTTFRLAKAWGANSTAGNIASLAATTGLINNTAVLNSTASTATNGTLVTVFAGETATLPAETMSPGTLANYTTTVSCDAGTLTGTNGQSAGNTLAITAAATATSPITCTYTNTPKTATLQLAKAWGANSSASDSASIGATTGGTNNTTLFSTAGGTAANSGAAVAITVGNTITFPAETGTNIGNYNTVLSCLAGGGATANTLSGTNGQVSNTLVIGAGDSGKAIVCTYTNTRKSTTFRLAKAWGANSTAGNIASLAATTGLINNTAVLNSTASTNSNGVAVTVFAGETATLPAETMSPGTLANYTTTVSCDAGTLTGTNGQSAGNTLAITAAATATSPITCTYTNTPKTATLQLAKAWGANSSASDSASIGATTGGTNNTSLFSTAGGTAANSGTAVAITVGNTITFPAETGTNIGNYNTVLSCLADGGATANTLSGTNGQASNTLVIGAGDSGKAIVCTYTNTRKSTTFRLAKAWGANSTAGNIASLAATTGLINNTAVLNSTASTATNGTLVTVFAGETATLPAETMSPGTLANYTTTVSCDAGTLTGTNGQSAGNTLAITAAATATSPITCTYTNTPKTATLQLAKAWGANSSASDSASIGATTGGTNNTTLFSTAGGTAANSGAAVAITVGNTITFPAETGTNIGNYNTVLSCLAGGGATANTLSGTNGQVSNTLVIGAGDSGKAIVCTYTNTRKSTTFRLAKAWGANSTAGNIASLAATTGLINNTAVLNSTASTNSNGVAVTVFAGETATLPAETMSPGTLANYTTTVSCDAGTLTGTNGQSAGNTLAITAAATATSPITCTYTNTPKTATLQLAKAWGANSSASDSASIGATTGGTNNTSLFSTAGGTAANSGTAVAITVGNTITFPAETGTNIGNYNTVLSCLADGGATANTLSGTNGQASNTLVIGAGDSGKAIVCTYTNTPKTATLQLAKAWGTNSSASDSASIGATTGGTNNTTLFSTAGGTAANSGAAVAITVGNTITFPAETGTNIGNYNTVLSCLADGGATANTLSGTNGQVSNTLVIGAGDSGKAIVCTYTNTRKSTTFRLAKAWSANSTAGNIASLACNDRFD
jgi:hypothetical protein